MSLDQAEFYQQIVEQVSTSSQVGRIPASPDESLSEWLEQSAMAASSEGTLASESLLEQLSEDIPQIGSATACVAYAGSIPRLSESIALWALEIDSSFNHFATHLFTDASSQQIGCAAVAVERLERFSPAVVNKGQKSFYSVCRLCSHTHIGKIEQSIGAAALTCPKCRRAYELLAFKLDGEICRVNELLTGWTPPVRVPKFETRLDEMRFIWRSVIKHVRYAKDLEGLNSNLDTWQLARETWDYENGDCEDSSILLADWLLSRGFDARVVIGVTGTQEGHAWCVVNIDGITYILETTDESAPDRRLPYASRLRHQYIPNYQFDRRSVYYLRDRAKNPRYWSEESWLRVDMN